jgi:hypothetical protein
MKKEEIDKIVNKISDIAHEKYDYNKNIAGYRLTCNGGYRDVSPRLPQKAFFQWCEAYLEGLSDTDEVRTNLIEVLEYIKAGHLDTNPYAVPCIRRAIVSVL